MPALRQGQETQFLSCTLFRIGRRALVPFEIGQRSASGGGLARQKFLFGGQTGRLGGRKLACAELDNALAQRDGFRGPGLRIAPVGTVEALGPLRPAFPANTVRADALLHMMRSSASITIRGDGSLSSQSTMTLDSDQIGAQVFEPAERE